MHRLRTCAAMVNGGNHAKLLTWGMNGCGSTSLLIVNAEDNSMGGVVEGGIGRANDTSPQKAAIEKVQSELRQKYSVRDETKRELDFLEKGGNLLDYKLRYGASVSIQSTSVTDQQIDQLVADETKGSSAFVASHRGDSEESSGRPGAVPYEANSADNQMSFDAETEFSEGGRSLSHPSRSDVPLEQSFHTNKTQKHGDAAAFATTRKAYKRRYRSRQSRDGDRSSTADKDRAHTLPSRHGSRDAKGLESDTQKQNMPPVVKLKSISPADDALVKNQISEGVQGYELDAFKFVKSKKDLHEGVSLHAEPVSIDSTNRIDEQLNQESQSSAGRSSNRNGLNGSEEIRMMEKRNPSVIDTRLALPERTINDQTAYQMNGFNSTKGDEKSNEAQRSNSSNCIEVLESELVCMKEKQNTDGNNGTEMCTKVQSFDSSGNDENQTVPDCGSVIDSQKSVKTKKDAEEIDNLVHVNQQSNSGSQSQENGRLLKSGEDLVQNMSDLKDEVKDQILIKQIDTCDPTESESDRKHTETLFEHPGAPNEVPFHIGHQGSVDISNLKLPHAEFPSSVSGIYCKLQTSGTDSTFASEIDEDSILKEAQIIEAKRKRIEELSTVTSPSEIQQRSQWNYVLEEMAWLSNDFAQERLWKISAAAQISLEAAVACRSRKQERSSFIDAKIVAHRLAKAVMEFWHSVEETGKGLGKHCQRNEPIRAYAARFMISNGPNNLRCQAEVPLTPDRASDFGLPHLSADSLKDEKFFYTIPSGAMETYRKSIISHLAQIERIGSYVQEEVETSTCDDFDSQDNAYDGDDGETSTYNMPVAFESSDSSRYGRKKLKHSRYTHGLGSYEMGSDLLPMQRSEIKVINQQSGFQAKRPGSSLNVSIPTKRVRTASRRIITPFSVGPSGSFLVPNKTDASSGDTSSFQDDQSTLHGGLLYQNMVEVESAGDFEKQSPFESAEVSTKPKKKKAKHLNAAYDQRYPLDSSFHDVQRDHLKRRSESNQFESNGNTGLYGQPMTKKPKVIRQSRDNSFENLPQSGASLPSPAASQLSNMSNPNKFIKMLGGRDRSRKVKGLKMPAGPSGPGSPWSLFEDQALVVLVHDLGPNWELVSDALNSTLRFKCVFRKAKECKERHYFLMDRTSGDGADSAEDSGSSQPYPSTLPGIPKGSARQLFQRLQGPVEEDALKSHFEKIILIGQKQQYLKSQDAKQLPQAHSSHTIALSQVCPNNLNGGPVLTPLDLYNAAISGPDVLPPGYQGTHTGGSIVTNQGTMANMHPASGACSAFQGSPNMITGNSFPSSPGPVNPSLRDGRHFVPRCGPLSADEQQRFQQYNQMIPGRNVSQANLPAPGMHAGTDHGSRINSVGSAMGTMPSVSRSFPMARPGFQGTSAASMVNSGSVVSPAISSNMHAGVVAGQGSPISRPRDAVHLSRPGLNQDSQRLMVLPDLQIPGNSQGASHLGGLTSSLPNQTASPPVSSYPLHHQQSLPISPQQHQALNPHQTHFQGQVNHSSNSGQQAFALRLAKERQLQQRLMLQQPQQFATSNNLMPHVQSQPQLPIPSPVQATSQVQPPKGPPVAVSPLTSSASMNSMSQRQQKHQSPAQGVVQTAQAGGVKQRSRHNQFSQSDRQHPHRPQLQAQQQVKVAKGAGRGNMILHQNIPIDSSISNGFSTSPGNQSLEKGESGIHLMQGQGLYAGSALGTMQPTRPYLASQSPNQSSQQKIYSGHVSSSSKILQVTSQSDNCSQGHVPPAVMPVSSASHQIGSSLVVAGSNHHQASSQQKLLNENQSAAQRVIQPNHHNNCSNRIQGRESDTDQHPKCSSTKMDTVTALPHAGSNTAKVVQAVSPPNAHHWHASESLLDSALNSPSNPSSMASLPSNSYESVPQVGQGLVQRSTANSPPMKHDVSVQWQQQQQSQVQQPHSPKSQLQLPLQSVHAQQQGQLLQAGNGDLYGRSSDPRLE